MIYQSYLSIIIAQTKTDIAQAVKIFESINHLPIIQEELVLHGLRDSHPYTALWSQFISALPERFLQFNEEMGS